MNLFFQIAALAVIGAVLCLVVRRYSPDLALVLSMLCCVAVLLAVTGMLQPILKFFRQLQSLSGLEDAALAPVLKTVAIGFLTQIAGAFCQDAGEQSLAKIVELSGSVLALYAALPLANSVLELLQSLLGG